MRLLGLHSRRRNAPQYVDLAGHWLKMRRVDASRYAAEMVKMYAIWDRPPGELVRDPMRIQYLTIVSACSDLAVSMSRGRRP